MKSFYNYVVKPKGNRYNNTKKIGDKELIVNTEVFNHQYVNKEAVIKRILGRLICSKCGLTFNKYFNPPQKKKYNWEVRISKKHMSKNRKKRSLTEKCCKLFWPSVKISPPLKQSKIWTASKKFYK